jgi:hypothetical protein
MDRKQYKLWFLSLTVLVSMMGLLSATQPAEASVSRWAVWQIEVAFPSTAIETDLVIKLGHTSQSGQKVIDLVDTFPVSCQAAGNPLIGGGQVTFDGNSYYECSVPNIRDLVYQMSNGTFLIPATCAAKRPYINVTATIDTTPDQINPTNPLFYRDDIQFGLPLDTSTKLARIEVNFDQASAESGAFTPSANGNTLTTIYRKTSNNTYTPTFVVDGTIVMTAPPVNGPFILSTLDSTIYLGYSPSTGKYFEGSMSEGVFDPGCVGQGL